MKVLIIGSGGREHALVWKLSQSKCVEKIYCAPGNPGIEILGAGLKGAKGLTPTVENVPIEISQLDKLVQFAKREKIDLAFVGPEVPLIDGIVDLFQKNHLPIAGPSKKAAQLEGSKAFAKKLMQKYGIPTAKFEIFNNYNQAHRFLTRSDLVRYPLVIKASGQAAGKGVLVAKTKDEALNFLKKIMVEKIFGSSGNEVVIEEYLEGPEVSFMVATDGNDFVSFVPSQDHKRIFDDDRGPNTGGMGAYAPVPFVDEELITRIENEIVKPLLSGMRKEGIPYEGILYPGLILTSDGPKVLEFNCRFGDPETQPLMELLKTDIIDIFQAIINKKVKNLKIEWYSGSAVCVILASKGYPGYYDAGHEISFARAPLARGTNIFHSGTKTVDEQLVTHGGRVLGITATGNDLKAAINTAYKCIGKKGVHFPGMQYRHDIGKNALLHKKNAGVIDYKNAGVNYNLIDPFKITAQRESLKTLKNIQVNGIKAMPRSIGESAFILETKTNYIATIIEGLGSKNLIADELSRKTGKSYYACIGYDTVASTVMDLITVGAAPVAISSYVAAGSSSWFNNRENVLEFIRGWKLACSDYAIAWGGGETPVLKDIIYQNTVDLAGSAVGIIEPKSHVCIGEKMAKGDRIILFVSSGIHVNGLTLAREVANKLPNGLTTKLPNGRMYGEELLTPTASYGSVVREIYRGNIIPHYMVNITGHGWRKIMRARQSFRYFLTKIPPIHPIFDFIQKHSRLSMKEMYATFNMGAGFAMIVHPSDVAKVVRIAQKHAVTALDAGFLQEGPKEVIISPHTIHFTQNALEIR